MPETRSDPKISPKTHRKQAILFEALVLGYWLHR